MPKMRKISNFHRGDEFEYREEHYRVTGADYDENSDATVLWTYCIEHPRTSPVLFMRSPDVKLPYTGHTELPNPSHRPSQGE